MGTCAKEKIDKPNYKDKGWKLVKTDSRKSEKYDDDTSANILVHN